MREDCERIAALLADATVGVAAQAVVLEEAVRDAVRGDRGHSRNRQAGSVSPRLGVRAIAAEDTVRHVEVGAGGRANARAIT